MSNGDPNATLLCLLRRYGSLYSDEELATMAKKRGIKASISKIKLLRFQYGIHKFPRLLRNGFGIKQKIDYSSKSYNTETVLLICNAIITFLNGRKEIKPGTTIFLKASYLKCDPQKFGYAIKILRKEGIAEKWGKRIWKIKVWRLLQFKKKLENERKYE